MSTRYDAYNDRPPFRLHQQPHYQQSQQRQQHHVRRHSDSDHGAQQFLNPRYTHQARQPNQYQQNWPPRTSQQHLIDRVTNEWQLHPEKFTSPNHDDYADDESLYNYGEDDDDDCVKDCLSSFWCSRRVRRYLCLYFLFLIGSFSYWSFYLKPQWREDSLLDRSLASQRPNQDFFSNARPQFAGMTQIQQLDEKYLPRLGGEGGPKGNSRLIFVGDVHGCKNELMQLLEEVAFDEKNDHLVLTGDIVYKGPDSGGVIDYARQVGASCVRGNHEDRTLLAANSMRHNIIPIEPPKLTRSLDETDNEKVETRGYTSHAEFARTLTVEQLDYLRSCPIILQVGQIGKKNYVVVHAGLVPGVTLDKQDPFHVMNMRTIDLASRVPTELRNGEPWDKVWNHYQKKRVPENERITVIYGHDAKKGLTIRDYTKGLDSACVSGGKLSALVVDEQGHETIHSVKCLVDYVKKNKSDD